MRPQLFRCLQDTEAQGRPSEPIYKGPRLQREAKPEWAKQSSWVYSKPTEGELKGSENICRRLFIVRETYDFPAVAIFMEA